MRITPSPVKITFTVVTISWVTTGNKNSIRSVMKRLNYHHRIHSSRAGNPNDLNVRRINIPSEPGHIRTGVRTPVAEKTDYVELLLIVYHNHLLFND